MFSSRVNILHIASNNSTREKEWRCRKRGTQATCARQGDLAGVTHTRQCQSFVRMLTHCLSTSATPTAGFLSFHPMAQCVVHALKGLACRARVTPASSPASVLSAHVACAPCARLRQSFSRTLTSQKTLIFLQWVQNLGTPRYKHNANASHEALPLYKSLKWCPQNRIRVYHNSTYTANKDKRGERHIL